jgi:hypothetical protein
MVNGTLTFSELLVIENSTGWESEGWKLTSQIVLPPAETCR